MTRYIFASNVIFLGYDYVELTGSSCIQIIVINFNGKNGITVAFHDMGAVQRVA